MNFNPSPRHTWAKLLVIIVALLATTALLTASLAFASPAMQATFQLSGRVTDQSSNPIAGAVVDVLNAGTSYGDVKSYKK